MLRFAVAGTGSFASRVIIPGLNASGVARVAALYGRTPERVADTAREHQIPNRFESYEEMLELKGLDAVAVCTPDFLHAPMAKAALASGRAVLSEKPLGMNSVETRGLARRAAELGIGTAVNFTYRSMPAFALAKEMIDSGEIGELISGNFDYSQSNWADSSTPLDWRMTAAHSAGGALGDLGSHVIDLLLWYGGAIEQVAGADSIASGPRPDKGGASTAPTASDNAAFVCDLGGGRLVAFHLTKLAWGHANQINVKLVGSRGAIRLFHERGDEVTIAAARPGESEFSKVEIPADRRVGYSDFPAHHMRQAVRGLLGEGEFASFEDGHRAQCVIDAVARSGAEKRWAPVDMKI